MHATCCPLRVIRGNENTRQVLHVLCHAYAVLALYDIIELAVEALRELVNQRDYIDALHEGRRAEFP
jgi:hypothetical protein